MIQQIQEVVTRLSGKQSASERLDDARELARLAQRLVEALAPGHPDCLDFRAGDPARHCESDGHYTCKACRNFVGSAAWHANGNG